MKPVQVDARTDEGYARGVAQVEVAARLALASDTTGLLERIGRAHSAGPILHPSLYREGMRGLGQVEALVRAADAFRRECERIVAEASPPPVRPLLEVVRA